MERYTIDAAGFARLAAGEPLTLGGGVQIMLDDIGFRVMQDAIDRAGLLAGKCTSCLGCGLDYPARLRSLSDG